MHLNVSIFCLLLLFLALFIKFNTTYHNVIMDIIGLQ